MISSRDRVLGLAKESTNFKTDQEKIFNPKKRREEEWERERSLGDDEAPSRVPRHASCEARKGSRGQETLGETRAERLSDRRRILHPYEARQIPSNIDTKRSHPSTSQSNGRNPKIKRKILKGAREKQLTV